MRTTVKKVLKTGYGLGLLTLSEGKRIAGKVKKDLDLNDTESVALAKQLVATSEKVSREVLKTASKYFEQALIKSKLAKKSDIARAKKLVRKRVAALRPKKESLLRKVKRRVTGR